MTRLHTENGDDRSDLRVLLVAAQYHPVVGGSEAQARLLAREFKRRGVRVVVWSRRMHPLHPALEEVDGVEVRRLGPSLPFRGSWARKVERAFFTVDLGRKLLAQGSRADVIFANQLQYPAAAAVLAGRRTGVPVVARVAASGPANELRGDGIVSRRQSAILLTGLRRVVALGPRTRKEYEEAGFPASRVAMIPNAVEMPSRLSSPEPASPLRALWLGKFRPEKRVDLAFLAWMEAQPPGTLVVVGDGDQRDLVASLAARCRGRRGADSVETKGLLEDPGDELSKSQIFIQSSDTEGMSNALLEAMGSGCACVATDVGETRFVLGGETAPEVAAGDFVEAEAGLLVRPSDVPGLTRALNALGDAKRRERLGTAARLRCALNHGVDGIVDRYLRLFAEVVGEPRF
jgi:glycosyltransferase involved in cell wall biosynthesis